MERMNQAHQTFSIVTPSYNQGSFIESTINSVLAQEGEFFINYVIMDGGSTDNSIGIIKKYDSLIKSKKYPIKCRGIEYSWNSSKDDGQYDAINEGFSISSGEIMGWINSDDVLLPSALKTVALIFKKFPEVHWITANSTKINKGDMIINVDTSIFYPRDLIKKGLFNGRDYSFIQQESTFWRRSLWNQLEHKLNIKYYYAADFELWIRLSELTELVKINTQLGAFRVHNRQKTSVMIEYHRETALIKKISLFDKMFIRLMRLLSRIYVLDRFCLLKYHAWIIYFNNEEKEWIMKRVKGTKI
jgi:glycosyltransferase involved in cell wall biosynthesis